MTIHVLVITHENIGVALVNATRNALGKLPLPTDVITVPFDTNLETLTTRLKRIVERYCAQGGVLILTDLFGATPSNTADQCQSQHVRMVSGLNLPMLIRVMNYPQLSLDELADKAFSGGRDGVVNCSDYHKDAA